MLCDNISNGIDSPINPYNLFILFIINDFHILGSILILLNSSRRVLLSVNVISGCGTL